jgi:hypothetical protein
LKAVDAASRWQFLDFDFRPAVGRRDTRIAQAALEMKKARSLRCGLSGTA